MESQDPHGAVSSVIKITRKATRIVQLAPFAYLVFFVAYLILGAFAPDDVLCTLDKVALTSPLATGGLLVASRLFKLCRWHKIACLLPTSSQIEGFVDSYLFTFTQEEIICINISLGIIALCFLVFAYRHFFNNARQ